MNKVEIAEQLKDVDYFCDELSDNLDCSKCPFTNQCDGLDEDDRLYDNTIQIIEDCLKENNGGNTSKKVEVKSIKSNKYQLLRRK